MIWRKGKKPNEVKETGSKLQGLWPVKEYEDSRMTFVYPVQASSLLGRIKKTEDFKSDNIDEKMYFINLKVCFNILRGEVP